MISHSPQVVLITGAGKGIGRAVVEALCKPGAPPRRLLLTSRTRSDLQALKERFERDSIEIEILDSDLAADPALPVETCIQRFGCLDALIHCAGVGRFGDFTEQTREDLEHTLATNITGTFFLLQRTYLQMLRQAPRGGLRGQIQVVTSVAAEQPFLQSSSYCMSKYAQRGLLDVLKLYGRRDGIRILEIRPGAAHTPMWGEMDPALIERMMSASDVAAPMVEALQISARASIETITLRPLHGDL